MMTTASIDLNLDVPSGGLASSVPVGGVPAVVGAEGAASASRPDVQAVAAFERALAGPIAENAVLTREIQKAIASLDAAFPLRASPRIAPASQLASLGGYDSPCESSPLPSTPVAVGAPVAAGLTRRHGETEIVEEDVSVRAQSEVVAKTDMTHAEPQRAQSRLDTGKPVPEVSTPSTSSPASAASASLRETSSRPTAPQPSSLPLRASPRIAPASQLASLGGYDSPRETSPLPSAPVAVGLTRSHGETEVQGESLSVRALSENDRVTEGSVPHAVEETVSEEALVAAGVVPQTSPSPAASIAAETPMPAVTPVEVVRTQAAQPLPPAQVLVQAAQAVADTLLVSPGLLRGQGEVVVRLRPDVLEGTEVRIAVTGRQLDVQFQPTTVDMAVLLENCRTQIANNLTAKIATFNVTVDVRKKRV